MLDFLCCASIIINTIFISSMSGMDPIRWKFDLQCSIGCPAVVTIVSCGVLVNTSMVESQHTKLWGAEVLAQHSGTAGQVLVSLALMMSHSLRQRPLQQVRPGFHQRRTARDDVVKTRQRNRWRTARAVLRRRTVVRLSTHHHTLWREKSEQKSLFYICCDFYVEISYLTP